MFISKLSEQNTMRFLQFCARIYSILKKIKSSDSAAIKKNPGYEIKSE